MLSIIETNLLVDNNPNTPIIPIIGFTFYFRVFCNQFERHEIDVMMVQVLALETESHQ